MQNFTLGKKGISMLLFGLVLLIGSSPIFGQTCPTETDTESDQTFCFLATVGDIQRDGTNTAVYQTADKVNDTQAIPSSELLSDNTTYYVGGQTGTCTRVPVTVNITAEDYPNNILFPGQNSFTISPCSSTFTAEELASYFTAISGYEIRVYDDEFGMTVASGSLTANNSYFVGQVSTDNTPTPGENTCPSLRVAVGYDPQPTPAPTATSPQVFCEGATVADLQAQGTSPNTQAIRWYRTATSFEALSNSTKLIPDATYYATQVINDRNSPLPPCESATRTPVTVTVNNIIVEETQRFCASIGEGNDFRKPEVQDLSPDGTWYADDTFTTPLAFDEELIDGDFYFTRIPENCETIVVKTEFFDTPNAGSTTSLNVCSNGEPFNLVDEINDSQLGAPQQTGRFSPELSTGTLIFDPSDYEPGSYTFRYIVEGNEDCPTDDSRITVVVQAAPNAGTDVAETVCSAELDNPEALIARFSSLIEDRDQDGTFSGFSLEEIAGQYLLNPISTFTTTYTVTNVAGCKDSASISIEVLQSPDAGEDATVNLAEEGNDPIDLFDRLGGSPDSEGTWSPGNGTFNPGTDTPGVFTYTVTNINGCEDTATVTVVAECPVVEETTQEFCASIGIGNDFRKPQVRDLMPSDATWYATADSETPLSDTTILEDGVNYFAGNASGTCPDRTPVKVVLLDTPNAGSTSNITVCSNDEPFDLIDRINPSILGAPDRDGTFSPALVSGGSIFDPALDIAQRYKYTVTRGTCPKDDAFITVNISQAPNAGVDINEELCISPDEDLLPTAQEFIALYADDNRDLGGTFNPSLNSLLADFTANPFRTFATIYSITTNGCMDTANLSVTITEKVPADAGADVSLTFCSTDGIQNLFESLGESANPNGTFEGLENGMFDTSTATIGEETVITYTVSEVDACVTGTDTAEFRITVIQGPDAGEDGSLTINIDDAPVNLFNSLEGTPDTGGIWSPGNENGDFDPSDFQPGTLEFFYTVTSENECTDKSTVTVTVTGEFVICPEVTNPEQSFCESIGEGNNSRKPTVSDLLPANATWYATSDSETALPANTVLVNETTYFAGNALGTCTDRNSVFVTLDDSPNAGATTVITVCADDAPFDIVTKMNNSLLGPAEAGGIVIPALASGTTIFNPAVDNAQRYTYRVFSTTSCPDDDAFITINILINEDANAGDDFALDYCTTDEDVNLFDLLADGVTMSGTFVGLTSGVFSPSTSGEGTFEIIYNVGEDLPCVAGADSATITITVNSVSEAPVADAEQFFCLIDNPTVGDIVVTGDNVVFYTDADLTDEVDSTTPLTSDDEDGTEYFAVANNDAATCSSEATVITVKVNDPDRPDSLPIGDNEFCRSDNPTLQDLLNRINGTGIRIYASPSGGTPLATTTALQDGVNYFATATDATSGCESSERLPIPVEVNFCGIPEGFSPNGDNINDRFVIPDIAINYPNYNIEIYNRWGNMVFKGNASTPDWNGISNKSGTLGDGVLPVGVYFYILNYNDGATPPIQGKLYLSR